MGYGDEQAYAGLASEAGLGQAWANLSWAEGAPDASGASAAGLAGGTSKLLRLTTFGFEIPDGAIAKSIIVRPRIKASEVGAKHVRDNNIRLLKADTPIGNNEADTVIDWPLDWLTRTYDGSLGADPLWGATWTPAELRAAGFGVQIQIKFTGVTAVTGYVDAVQIVLGYVEPGWLGRHWINQARTFRWLGG